MVPFIGNLHLAMLDGGANAKEVKSIKMALMGPMAGIGDSLSQFCLAPLFATIGASLAQDGLILGPAIFFLGMNITLLIIKLLMGSGHKSSGQYYLQKLSSYMGTDFHNCRNDRCYGDLRSGSEFCEDFYEAAVCGTGFGDRREDHFSAGDVGCHASEHACCIVYRFDVLSDQKEKMEYIQTGYLYDHRGNPSFCDRYTWIK